MITDLHRAIAQEVPLGFLAGLEVATWRRKAGRTLHVAEDCSRYAKQKSTPIASQQTLGEIASQLCEECSVTLTYTVSPETRTFAAHAGKLALHKEHLNGLGHGLARARLSQEERAASKMYRYRLMADDGAPKVASRAAGLQQEISELRRLRISGCHAPRCRDVYSCTGSSSPECVEWARSHPHVLSAYEELDRYALELTRHARILEREAAELARSPKQELQLIAHLASLEVHKRYTGQSDAHWRARGTSTCPAHLRQRAKVLEVEQVYHFGKPRLDDVVAELWQHLAGALHPSRDDVLALDEALAQVRELMHGHVKRLRYTPPNRGTWTDRTLTIDEVSENSYAEDAWREEVTLVIEELFQTWRREIVEIVEEAAPGGVPVRALVALCNTGRERLGDPSSKNVAKEWFIRYEPHWVGGDTPNVTGGLAVVPRSLARAISTGGVHEGHLRGVEITTEIPSEEVITTAVALLGDELSQVEANAKAAEVVRSAVLEVIEAASCALA